MSIAANAVFNAFVPLFSDKSIDFELVGTESMPLPSFPLQLVKDLLKEAEEVFSKETSNVAHLDGDIFVIGDIHGNIRDLIRILASASPPPTSRFLFLGDYVDRGEYSFESIILLLALAIKFPHHITLLRGNHEYDNINSTYGFMEQVIALFGQSGIYELFNCVFSYMQIAAIVADTTLCVHGGLSPLLKNLSQLEDFDRTLNPPCELLNDVMWSDPSTVTDGIIPSTRGNGCMFGHAFLVSFLNNNNLIRLIRGHECVKNGVRVGKDSKIITVFSTCNYKGEGSNQCGIIKILEDGNFQAFNLHGISILHREDAAFNKVSYEQKKHKINCMILSSPSMNNLMQSAKISTRGSTGHIPLCGSCMRMKTMGIRKSNQQLLAKPDSLLSNSSPSSLDPGSPASILCGAHSDNIDCSNLTNSTEEDAGKAFKLGINDLLNCNSSEFDNNHFTDEKPITLPILCQPRTPQIKKPFRSVAKASSLF
ncbi:hypothetical protein M9Y10_000935 [Tritrichomonas musculus]|uniref:Serine/threonine-protein phosphatase n=1 Tax=Tritrichomonas musculus TaxID=1915356 RepID=A0ABR2L5L1_9EUKA